MTSYNRDGKVGPWAEEKLKCLGDYLSAYTTILRKQEWCREYLYIDAFAGAGRAEVRVPGDGKLSPERLILTVGSYGAEDAEEISYLDGSPYIALNIRYPFSRYIFIEKNSDRANKLNMIAEEYKGRCRVEVIKGDASSSIELILNDHSIDWQARRAVIFLDPFGMQVPWCTVEAIARNGGIEIMLNLPVGMAIQRLLPRSGQFSEIQRNKLSTYFGASDWERIIDEQTTDLFGYSGVNKVHDSGERLAYWYRDRLRDLFGFAPEPRLIRNSRGSHLYYLLFAGPNKTGAKIASGVFLKQGERVSRPRGAK